MPRYRHPLITYIVGPADSSKEAIARALFNKHRDDLAGHIQLIENHPGGDELPIVHWKLPDRVIVTSDQPPSPALRRQLYEVIDVSARRRPAWLKRQIAKRASQAAGKAPV